MKYTRVILAFALILALCAPGALSQDSVDALSIADGATQLIIVAATGSEARLTMHEQDGEGRWTQILDVPAQIGKNGVGKTREGDGKTPAGAYGFMFAFGTQPNPGALMDYTRVDESHYWVDDNDSVYYNQFVSARDVEKDWDSAEQLAGVGEAYDYVLALDYNSERVPGLGSAIFMHCLPTGGAGCIAIEREHMLFVITHARPDCVILIDEADAIMNY